MILRALALAAIVGVGARPAWAQVPQRVLDVNQTPDAREGIEPRALSASNAHLFFAGVDDENGHEVRSVSASGEIGILRDIEPGPSSPVYFQDGHVAATTNGAWLAAGDSLYFSDGTPAGTRLVHRHLGQHLSGVTVVAGGRVFYKVLGASSTTLWTSDGSEAGTVMMAAVDAETMTPAGSQLFFLATTTAAGTELWRSNGTAAGTQMVIDLCPGTCPGVVDDRMAAIGNTLFFIGYDGVSGVEVWKSGGQASNTALVRDIVPGPGSSNPARLASFGSLVLFGAGNNDLWRSDGTVGGTSLIATDLKVESPLHDAGGFALFGGFRNSGKELWRTDGTAAGTTAVTTGCPGFCSIQEFGGLPGAAVFTIHAPPSVLLWRTDGTPAGTSQVTTVDEMESLTRFGNHVYFAGFDAANGEELWRTDGTAAGTVRVTNRVQVASHPQMVRAVGGRMFFTANRPDTSIELWATDGTPASTTLLELTPGPSGIDLIGSAAIDDDLVFGISTSATLALARSDGTPAGTSVFATGMVATGAGAVVGGATVFRGPDGEPWRTDGTSNGTYRLADVQPGPGASNPGGFVAFGDQIAFITGSGGATAIWRTDGTPEGTAAVTSRACKAPTGAGDRLYLVCEFETQLWVSDGTDAGTRLVKDIAPNHPIENLVAVDDTVYFTDVHGEIWRSDGTEAGTLKLTDLVGAPVGVGFFSGTVWNGALYYAGFTPELGVEMWRTDGTAAGTHVLRDVLPGPGWGIVPGYGVAAGGGRLIFAAYTPERGLEPWVSDGTAAGTLPLPEIVPGPGSSSPSAFKGSTNGVYFSASDGVTGYEPWAVLSPAAIAVADVSVVEGAGGTTDAVFEVTLGTPAGSPVQVAYATVAGTAMAGSDFTPRAGTLTFAPGTTALTVAVPVAGDLQDEPDESFTLELSAPVGAVFADRRAFGFVSDDDGPRVTIGPATVLEGDAGSVAASFAVQLTTSDGLPTPTAKTVSFAPESATATAGLDFEAAGGALTFAPGTPSGTVGTAQVSVLGDAIDEPDESFLVRLVSTSDVVPGAPAAGRIVDDDGVDAARPQELSHGSSLRASLAPPPGRTSDRDWYLLGQAPDASYEVVVDEVSGDAVPLTLRRVAADGTTVLQTAVPVGTGGSVSLRWRNATTITVADQHVLVESAACGTACGADDRYRVRAYETTLRGPRFNNAGSQRTALLLHNPTPATIAGEIVLWNGTGGLAHRQPFTLAPRTTTAVDTASVSPGASGSISVTHDGPYGALVGKAVSLDPSAGLSFDTPLTSRPR